MRNAKSKASQAPGIVALLLYFYSLWGFSIAQPIYSDLFRDGGFFRWHQNTTGDIWLALFVISFCLPGFAMLVFCFFYQFFPSCIRKLCYLLIHLLVGCFFLLLMNGLYDVPFLAKALIAMICSIWLTRKLFESREHVFLLYFLVPGALMFPVFFGISCPLTSPFHHQLPVDSLWRKPPIQPHIPIVLIVFDELPLLSLLDKQGQIDAVHFPYFAELARTSTWFSNAVTVHSITRGAVPSILTGQYPSTTLNWSGVLLGRYERSCKNPIPTARTFPHTLFTWLEHSYKMQVYESRVYLYAGPGYQKQKLFQSDLQRVETMFRNIGEEYFFKILFNSKDLYKLAHDMSPQPEASSTEESPISHDYDIMLFRKFTEAIHHPKQDDKQPSLYFIHPILPHSPWEFYPSGQHYSSWKMADQDNDVLCNESPSLLYCQNSKSSKNLYQRHLMQVGYVDALLGQALAKLKAANLYDQALIIVTADHGISFMSQEPRRTVNVNNFSDIMSIPLFIKKPGQHQGNKNLRQAETIDILPTIAGLLQFPLYWHTDGKDLFSPMVKDRNSHSVCSPVIQVTFSTSQTQAARMKALQMKVPFQPVDMP